MGGCKMLKPFQSWKHEFLLSDNFLHFAILDEKEGLKA